MRRWIAACFALLLAVPPAAQGAPPQLAIQGQFDLTTLDGREVTLANYRGKWLLVYFGYTFCPDVCPTVLTEISGALKDLGTKASRVQVLFITIDPVRDSRSVMARYLKAFDPRIQGLRGDADATELAAKSFHVYYRARAVGGGEYAIDHSSYVYVINPEGKFVELLAPDVPGHKMADDVRQLIG
ncbi:MAG TPA: SCO family protein [Rhizomicrobium sp.]|nr:SCO family protein [Rhizomicrobium sp.]